MHGPRKRLIVAFCLALLSLPLLAQGSIQHSLTPADRGQVQAYKLDEASFQKLLAVAHEARASKQPIDIVVPQAHSLADTVQALHARPAVTALLARHGLSTRDFVLGEYALLGAEFAVKYPDQPGSDASLANPDNIALYRRHQADLDALSSDDVEN